MTRSLRISADPIDELALVGSRPFDPSMGAIIYFSGVVRGSEGDESISGLEYSAFIPMAERQFHLLFDEIEKRWPIASVRLVHRLGIIRAGEASLWVETVSPHRAEAFAAAQWLINEMKRVVPIWKKPLPVST